MSKDCPEQFNGLALSKPSQTYFALANSRQFYSQREHALARKKLKPKCTLWLKFIDVNEDVTCVNDQGDLV